MRLPKISFFSSSSKTDPPTSPKSKDYQAAPIGAGVAEPLNDHYSFFSHTLKWIEETKQKLPAATPLIRREAFLADPLLRGTIYPYLKNVLLQGFTIQTIDNKLYSGAITDITDYLEALGLMQVFREDFINYAILDGHSFRRTDPDLDGNIVRLEKIDPSSTEVFNDPWDSSIVAYHQKARVRTSWSSTGTTQDVDSWFIPFSNELPDINSTYIQGRETGNDQRVYELFTRYTDKYSISDITNLRITSSERVIAMHNSERLVFQNYYDNYHYNEVDNPAPIDSVILAIWLKRLLLVNAPNLIFVILSPFLQLKSGIVKETKDFSGNPIIITSTPQKPSTAQQAVNPDLYNAQLANWNAWIEDTKEAMKNLTKCLKNGGVFASGPDQEIKPIESSRNVSYQFIKGLIDQLNEEIGLAFGFPMSLVLATGTELASSRNILQIFNSVHAGERTEYESVADSLIKKTFAGKTWVGIMAEKDDSGNIKEVQITYTFEEIKAHFTLDIPDTKDLLSEAQAYQTRADTLTKIKGVGASREDLQALGEEYGFGLLGLDNFQAPTSPAGSVPGGPEEEGDGGEEGISQAAAPQVNTILKACLLQVMQEQGVISASPTDPSNFKDKKITKRLQEAYKTAKETIDQLFEEH